MSDWLFFPELKILKLYVYSSEESFPTGPSVFQVGGGVDEP